MYSLLLYIVCIGLGIFGAICQPCGMFIGIVCMLLALKINKIKEE